MNAMERFEQWCNNPYFDQATRAELRALAEAGDTKEIEDRFYRDLALWHRRSAGHSGGR